MVVRAMTADRHLRRRGKDAHRSGQRAKEVTATKAARRREARLAIEEGLEA